jgi:hypothetical protein
MYAIALVLAQRRSPRPVDLTDSRHSGASQVKECRRTVVPLRSGVCHPAASAIESHFRGFARFCSMGRFDDIALKSLPDRG